MQESRDPSDPCRDPTFLENLTGSTAHLAAECEAAEARRDAERLEETRRVIEEREQAEAEVLRQKIAEETEQQREFEAAAEARADKIQEQRDAQEERHRYATLISISDCNSDWDEDRRRYEMLAEYMAADERDAAIGVLEGCRRDYVADARKFGPKVFAAARREFALDLEDGFDENNPYNRGALVAKVDGTTLRVRLKGNFEGRARHSQAEVDAWCSVERAVYFSKIVLKNSHGTFSCTPVEWPGSSRALITAVLVAAGAAEPLSREPGRRPVPSNVASSADPFSAE